LHFNFCLGVENALSASPENLFYLKSSIEKGARWGFIQEGMEDLSLMALAVAMGASVVRIGYEDSFYYAPNKLAPNNTVLVEQLVRLITLMGFEAATPQEARQILGVDRIMLTG
jgi:3-keto-5-aminohexanoate cleavage enzyme